MDFHKISVIAERYRPLPIISSLPFTIAVGEDREAAWFNYSLDKNGENLMIYVSSIYVIDGEMKVREVKGAIRIETGLDGAEEPVLSEEEYLSEMSRSWERLSVEELDDLLARAEMKPILPTYQAVRNKLEQELKGSDS